MEKNKLNCEKLESQKRSENIFKVWQKKNSENYIFLSKKYVKKAFLRNRIKRVFRHLCQENQLSLSLKAEKKVTKENLQIALGQLRETVRILLS